MEHEYNTLMTKRSILIASLFLFFTALAGQSVTSEFAENQPAIVYASDTVRNELTIFVIPSRVKYDWTSPRTLCKSFFKNYKHNLLNRKSHILGHAFLVLNSPLLPERIYTGMRAASRDELKDLVFKEHYGLAILGTDTKGELESAGDLDLQVDKFSKNGQMAFITVILGDKATERMISFFQSYKAGTECPGSPGARYGGAFWPRYKGEGSGCSAFVLSFLDLAGLLRDDFDKWKLKINIPMELIGGPYNHNKEVRIRDIKKHDSWTTGYYPENSGHEYLELYDPTLIYEWIQSVWNNPGDQGSVVMTPVRFNNARGLKIDARDLPVPANESIFQDRIQPSIFIDYFFHKSENGR